MRPPAQQPTYLHGVGAAIRRASDLLRPLPLRECSLPFYAAKLLEGDKALWAQYGGDMPRDMREQLDALAEGMHSHANSTDNEMVLADALYDYIEEVVRACFKRPKVHKMTVSERIDAIVLHRVWALPIFAFSMFIMFWTTFGPFGSWLGDGMEYLIQGLIAPAVQAGLSAIGTADWLVSLICDGRHRRRGQHAELSAADRYSVLLPVCPGGHRVSCARGVHHGYAAAPHRPVWQIVRAHADGLWLHHACGYGRAHDGERCRPPHDHHAHAVHVVQCQAARLCAGGGRGVPGASGAGRHQPVCAWHPDGDCRGLHPQKTIFREVSSGFVLELPTYRMPSFKGTVLNMWQKAKDFITRAGTIIFLMSVVIWLLQNFTPALAVAQDAGASILGVIGTAIAPVFAPLGFSAWQESVSLLTGLAAKEAVVSTMSVLYGASSTDLSLVLSGVFTPLSGYCFLVFTLLYMPCMSAFATIKREMGGWRWAFGAAAFQTVLAYLTALVIYQVGSLIL